MRKGLVFALILSILLIPSVSYGITQSVEVRNVFPFEDDQTFEGLYGGTTYYFSVKDNWKIFDASYFELSFSHSRLQNGHDSSITVFLNEKPLDSIRLDKENEDNAKLRIKIKPEYIQKGFNTLSINSIQNISDDCEKNRVSPSNWLVIHKDCLFHLEFFREGETLSISEFPYPFYNNASEKPVNSYIVLPNDASDKMMTAAFSIAAGFRKGDSFKSGVEGVGIIKVSEMTDDIRKSNLIFLVKASDPLLDELQLKTQVAQLESDRYLYKISASPWDSSKCVFIITGKSEDAILNGSRVLSDSSLTKQINQNEYVGRIADERIFTTGKETGLSKAEKLTLEQLGMEDLKVEGAFEQNANFSIMRNGSRELTDGAYIELNFSHSEVIDYEKSVLTLYLNSIPIKTINLNAQTASDGLVKVDIPKDFYKENALNFTASFFLHIRDIDDCFKYKQNAWGLVKKTSNVFLPDKENNELKLSRYPNLFNSHTGFKDLLIVLPDNANKQELAAAASVTAAMGSTLTSAPLFEVIHASNFSDNMKNKDILIIGTPSRNKLIQQVNEKLGLRFSKGMNKLESNTATFLDALAENCGMAELAASPFNGAKRILLLSATAEEGIQWVVKVLEDKEKVAEQKADTFLVNSKGDVFNYNVNKKQEGIFNSKEGEMVKIGRISVDSNILIFTVAMILMLVILSIMVLILLRRRNKSK
ncbi:MAG: cellulose biosynthesis cyclic di-GMP-binding regulatory protein BcsB [Clostridia bacterium]|nr:cellulose biosynthesis cyclic di-GMP-binding regulatory protein BcsB [Clostridia bacterium]